MDLLEYVDSYLASTGMRQVSQYYVSPVSETVLAYADILPEWYVDCMQDTTDIYAGFANTNKIECILFQKAFLITLYSAQIPSRTTFHTL